MGKSTISTGPFSIANCNKLPEGIMDSMGDVGRSFHLKFFLALVMCFFVRGCCVFDKSGFPFDPLAVEI